VALSSVLIIAVGIGGFLCDVYALGARWSARGGMMP
jgi:hypothetical protein